MPPPAHPHWFPTSIQLEVIHYLSPVDLPVKEVISVDPLAADEEAHLLCSRLGSSPLGLSLVGESAAASS